MLGTAYLFQAILVIGWWIGLSVSDSFYQFFSFSSLEKSAFSAFLMPDILIISVLSLIKSYLKIRDIQLVILGAFLYATLFCINSSIISGDGYLSTTAMSIGMCYNLVLCYGNKLFKNAPAESFLCNSYKTLIQIVCVWFLTLIALPFLIQKTIGGIILPDNNIYLFLGLIVFVLFSILGLTSAYYFVKYGDGTPLPLDQTNKLVITGPYSYIRNPMVVAGVGQGISISIMIQSFAVLLYSLLGAVAWQLVFRPFEELDMKKRFGEDFLEYKENVRCWFPRM